MNIRLPFNTVQTPTRENFDTPVWYGISEIVGSEKLGHSVIKTDNLSSMSFYHFFCENSLEDIVFPLKFSFPADP